MYKRLLGRSYLLLFEGDSLPPPCPLQCACPFDQLSGRPRSHQQDVFAFRCDLLPPPPPLPPPTHLGTQVWSLTPSLPLLAVHIYLRPGAEPGAVLSAVTAVCRRAGIEHTTVQLVADGGPCPCHVEDECPR